MNKKVAKVLMEEEKRVMKEFNASLYKVIYTVSNPGDACYWSFELGKEIISRQIYAMICHIINNSNSEDIKEISDLTGGFKDEIIEKVKKKYHRKS